MNLIQDKDTENSHNGNKADSQNGFNGANGAGAKDRLLKFRNDLSHFTRGLIVAADKKFSDKFKRGKIHWAYLRAKIAQWTEDFRKSKALDYADARLNACKTRAEIWFDSSFRNKVFVPVMACTVAVLLVTFFVVQAQLARQSQNEARAALSTASAAFHYAQDLRRNDLLMRFHNLPNVPLWNDLFQSGAPRDLHNSLRSLMEMQKVDIVFYVSDRGKTLDAVSNPGIPTSDFEDAAARAVLPALRGEEKADTVQVAGKLYDVVAIPAYDSDNKQIGALALGSELGDAAVQEFSKLTQGQVALVANGHIIASSLPGLETNPKFISLFNGAMPKGDDATANMKSFVFNGVHYHCIASHFASLAGDNNLGYVLLSSGEQSLVEKHAAQRVLAVVSLLAIVLSAIVVWYFINKATKPLLELRQNAEAVGLGDFNHRMAVTSRDECGQLAAVFNRMTENLQQSHSQLEKAVVTLKNTQDQLVQREKLSAIGEFVAGVAHELNNPMTAVVGFSELLKKQTTDETSQRYSDRIFQAAMRCKKIVQSLLSFARRDKPQREPSSINKMIETVLDIVGYALRTSNIEVIAQFEPNPPAVMVDAHQIQQVLLNIIGNAQQAIEASQPYGRIKIITESIDSTVRVTIEDNGPGIAPENMPKIFDPFFTTKDVGKGTGLGLSLCYGFIKEHGGTISVQSEIGKGATFVIELPAMETVTVESHPTEQKRIFSGHGRRILIVDDEEPILTMIRDDLTSQGYKVEVTTDGERAVRELEDKRFDLAICDWKMPGMNGRQIYEQLRDTNPQICERMIFITGDVVNPQIRRFIEKENRPLVAKPFTLSEFHSAVENVLEAA